MMALIFLLLLSALATALPTPLALSNYPTITSYPNSYSYVPDEPEKHIANNTPLVVGVILGPFVVLIVVIFTWRLWRQRKAQERKREEAALAKVL